MAESILGGLATQLTAAAQLAALNDIYARLGSGVTITGTVPVSAASLPLPTGASTEATLATVKTAVDAVTAKLIAAPATSALQTSGNASLTSIDGKLTSPALASGAATATKQDTIVTALGLVKQESTAIRGIRRDSDTSPVADGVAHELTTNAVGRLKVSAWPGAFVATTGTITTGTSTVTVDVSRASNIMVTITGIYAGINATFEVSIDGGTNWFATQAVRTNGNTIETATGVIATGLAYGWELSVNAMTNFRVRATAHTSGTGTVTILPGAYATEPIPAIPTHAVTGSGTFTVAGTVTANNFPQPPTTGAGVLLPYTNTNTLALALVKATVGRLMGYRIHNPNSATAYLQVFNAASTAAVTLGTTVPLEVFPIPAGATLDGIVDFSYNYSAGIVIAATTGLIGQTAGGLTAPTTGLTTLLRYV